MLQKSVGIFCLQYLIHICRIFLKGVLRNLKHLKATLVLTERYLDYIAYLDVVGSTCHLAVYLYSAGVTRLICDSSAFYYS